MVVEVNIAINQLIGLRKGGRFVTVNRFCFEDKIKIQTAGTYYLFSNVRYPDPDGDSFHAAMDEKVWYTVGMGAYNSVGSAEHWSKSGRAIELTAGEHTLTIFGREDGIRLNQLVLTTDAEANFTGLQTPSEREQLTADDIQVQNEAAVMTPELDTAVLEEVLTEAETLISEDYTAESWAVLEEAVAGGMGFLEKGDFNQEQIDEAAENIRAAMAELELVEQEVTGDELQESENDMVADVNQEDSVPNSEQDVV